MEPAQEVPKIGPRTTANTQSAEEVPIDLQCRTHPGTQTDPGPPTEGVKRGLARTGRGKFPSKLQGIPRPFQPQPRD